MSAEGMALGYAHSVRAIALRAAVASVEGTTSYGSESEAKNRVIHERAKSFESYIRTGEF